MKGEGFIFYSPLCYTNYISTILRYIKALAWDFKKTTLIGSLVFVLGLIIFGPALEMADLAKTDDDLLAPPGFGGPPGSEAGDMGLAEGGFGYPTNQNLFLEDPGMTQRDALYAPSYPLTNLIPTRDGFTRYKVRKGDTVSGLSAQFGVSPETIRYANQGLRTSLSLGQELTILPVSGVLYEIREGDDIFSVASRFGITVQSIQQYNPQHQKLFENIGSLIVLPNVKPSQINYLNQYVKGLPDLKSYFVLPARGWNWGNLHEYNAVDIADKCGTPIYAAAEGLVIEESGNNYWNNGYGNQVLIEHPNGTKTRYAHTDENFVRVGDYIAQGKEIATIGSTGNTHGPTGCHLHFEIYGAKNPFVIR